MPAPESTMIETRLALHSVAEHVVAPARHRASGKVGLRPSPNGFRTPAFPSAHGERSIRVAGTELVVLDDRGERCAPLTTVAAAADLAETEPGAPADVYTATTQFEPDAFLAIDLGAANELAAWWSLVDRALAVLRSDHEDLAPTETQLWPEHFDIATEIGEVSYGGSPGDHHHALPYLYVACGCPKLARGS